MANRKSCFKGESGTTFKLFVAALVIFCLVGPGLASSSTLTAIPRINIKYNFNDNIYGLDSDITDDLGDDNASSMDYMAGVLLRWVDGKNTFQFSGDVGYEQFLDLGDYFDILDADPSDFDYITGQAGLLYRYTGRVFTFTFADNFSRQRDLQRVFGMGTDALGYWALFAHNNAMVGIKYSPTPRSRNSLSYSYDTLVFSDPEDIALFDLSDSAEHRVLYRGEYDFTPKTTGILDFQAADRSFSDLDFMDAANFRLYQAYAGLRFNLRQLSYLEMLGGYAMRDIYDQPDAVNLEDTHDAIGRISFVTNQPKRYNVNIYAERGVSLYGTNLFFVYNTVGFTSQLWATPKLSFKLNGNYRQSEFDLGRNDREDVWADDRIDNLLMGTAAIQWDILQKDGEGTLILEGGYGYQNRDSNIDSVDDYVNGGAWSYDTIMNYYYVQLQIKPTILLGNR